MSINTVSLDKEYLRNQVRNSISLMASTGKVIREIKDNYGETAYYGEVTDYGEVTELSGLLYSSNGSYENKSLYKDKGIVDCQLEKFFLLDYSDNSKKLKSHDLIFFENGQAFEVTFIDENFEIYFQANLIQSNLKYESGFIVDNDNNTFEVMTDLPEEFWEDLNNG